MHSRIVEGDADAAASDAPAAARLLVPSSVAGALLGHGGRTIAALRDATGCSIRLVPYSHADELLAIAGEPAAVRAALLEASHRLRRAPRTPPLPLVRSPRALHSTTVALAPALPTPPLLLLLSPKRCAAGMDSPAPQLCYRLLCPQTHVGALLGRGGGVVAALRAVTGARIKVHARACADRIVTFACADDGAAALAPAQVALARAYAAIAASDLAASPAARLLLTPAAAALRGAWLDTLRRDTGCAARLAEHPPGDDALLELELELPAAEAPFAALAALAAVAARLRAAHLGAARAAVVPAAAPRVLAAAPPARPVAC